MWIGWRTTLLAMGNGEVHGGESISLLSSQNVQYLLFTTVLQHLPQDEHPSVLYGVLPELTNIFSCFLAATAPCPFSSRHTRGIQFSDH